MLPGVREGGIVCTARGLLERTPEWGPILGPRSGAGDAVRGRAREASGCVVDKVVGGVAAGALPVCVLVSGECGR